MSNLKKILYGTGICAQAVVDALGRNNLDLIQPVPSGVETDLFLDELKFKISNPSFGGLSLKYHGVTPGRTLKNKDYHSFLRSLRLKTIPKIHVESYYVPWIVPRPKLKGASKEETLYLPEEREIFLCLSVVGNLQALQRKKYVPDLINISDDLIVRIGSVSDLPSEFLPRYHWGGTEFPVIEVPNGVVTFRPIFGKNDEIDFTKNVAKQLFKGSLANFVDKVSQALYLKSGLQPLFRTPKKWSVVLQLNVKNFYSISATKVSVNRKLLGDVQQVVFEATSQARMRIPKFHSGELSYFNGIHLGYDRCVLAGVPTNISVLDTSLNPRPGAHPTIQTYCTIRETIGK